MNVDLTVPVRERLLAAALALIEADGWSTVTMAKVASAAGVSRQTVYNEFGTKHGLAQELTMHEVALFLGVAHEHLTSADDLVTAVRDASTAVLEVGRTHVLIRTVAGPWAEGADLDFLSMLTTESGQIVDIALVMIRDVILERFGPLPMAGAELDAFIESIIRLLLSHLTRPSSTPEVAADAVATIVHFVLAARTVG